MQAAITEILAADHHVRTSHFEAVEAARVPLAAFCPSPTPRENVIAGIARTSARGMGHPLVGLGRSLALAVLIRPPPLARTSLRASHAPPRQGWGTHAIASQVVAILSGVVICDLFIYDSTAAVFYEVIRLLRL